MSVDKLSFDDMYLHKMTVYRISIDIMTVYNMSINIMIGSEMSIDKLLTRCMYGK